MSDGVKAPVGIRNCNPGNLIFMKYRPYDGQLPEPGEGGFGKYVTMIKGVRASCKDLLAGFRQVTSSQGRDGEDTVEEIIHEWSTTDQEPYIDTVCKLTGFDRKQVLTPDPTTLFMLLRAIFRVENGGWFVSDDVVRQGVAEALT